jgi:hypothetical protein
MDKTAKNNDHPSAARRDMIHTFLCFTVSRGGVEQVFRPAVKLKNPPGFSR